MKNYILFFLTAGIILAAALFGMIKRRTYTNLQEQENYLEQLQVAELPEEIAENTCTLMRQSLPEANIILRVKVTGEIEHLFGVDRQKVCIQEVYTGSELEEGTEIYLISRHWKLALTGDPHSLERGFVNILSVGSEYLVFAQQVVESLEEGIPIVKLYDDFYLTPVFCYENRINVIFPTTGETTYVPYGKVKNNEFFIESERALQILETFKEELLAMYPIH